MAKPHSVRAPRGDIFPATTRLRGGLLVAPDAETLVALFADALSEHGISGHFCLRRMGDTYGLLLGDRPELVGREQECLVIESHGSFLAQTRMLLAPPMKALLPEQMARIRGYAELYAARAVALQELADDVQTECGLSLRERFVLGRRLAGLAPVDIALESDLSVATVSAAIDSAIDRLGVCTLPEAISLAARRGWLAVTSLQNCSSSSEKLTYKTTQNG
jgi:DNA-binding CsgD family transcriptional regulator